MKSHALIFWFTDIGRRDSGMAIGFGLHILAGISHSRLPAVGDRSTLHPRYRLDPTTFKILTTDPFSP